MKRTIRYAILFLFVAVLCAFPIQSRVRADKATDFQAAGFGDLRPESQLAIAILDMAKRGQLESCPFVRVSPGGVNLKNRTDYKQFKPHNVAILDFSQGPDGTCSQSMVVESLDTFGRVDLSDDRIVYRVTDPNEKEAAEYEELIIKYSEAVKAMNRELRIEIQKAVVDYQKASGLTADGIIGKGTAASLSRKTPMCHVQELSSDVVYPPEPRHGLYIVPFETVAQDREGFDKGFESLAVVERHAIPLDDFREAAKPQRKFILFVYFFDRVDPASAIQVGFSTTAKRRSKPMSPRRYIDSGEWPVLVEPFSIDQELPPDSSLYLNLLKSDVSKSGRLGKSQCIGSYRLK